jgi:hypothetical protein
MHKDMTDNDPKAGIIEGFSRILRELLRSPNFKASLRAVIRDLDAENAPLLLRAVRDEDPALLLDLMSAAPALANAVMHLLHSVLQQMRSYPEPLTAVFGGNVIGEIDTGLLGEVVGGFLAFSINTETKNDDRFLAGIAKGLEGFEVSSTDAVNAVADHLEGLAKKHPEAVGKIVAPLLKAGQRAIENEGEND